MEDLDNLSQDQIRSMIDEIKARKAAEAAQPVQEPTSPLESFARGTAEEATMGFAGEIEAAIDTVMSGDISVDNYYKNKAISNEEFKKAENDNPNAYMAGQGTGLVGSMFIPGLNVAKGAKIGTYAAKGAISGAITGAGKAAEGETLEGAATGGAVGGVLGGVIGKTIDKVSGAIANKKASQMLDITTRENIKLTQQHLNKVTGDTFLGAQRLKQQAGKTGVDLTTYLETLGSTPALDKVDGNKLVSSGKKIFDYTLFNSTDELLEGVTQTAKDMESARAVILRGVDAKSAAATSLKQIENSFNAYLKGKPLHPDTSTMATKMFNDIDSSINQVTSMTRNAEGVMEVVSEVKNKISGEDLYNLRKIVDGYLKDPQWASVHNSDKKQLVTIARNVINNNVDNISGGIDREVREQLQHTHFLQEHLEKAVNNPKTKWGGVTDQAALAASVMSGSPQIAVLKAMYNISKDASPAVAIPLMKTASFLQKRGSGAARTLTRLSMELDNPEQFGKIVESVSAQSDLEDTPIERNYADIINKQDQILAIVNNEVPEMYHQMVLAFEEDNKEALLPLLDQVSKNPKFSKYFVPGTGMDGRVYTEEDKKSLIDQIRGFNISTRQIAEHVKNVMEKGIVPVIQEETHPASLFAQKLQKPRM